MELTYKHLELAYKISMDAHAGQKYGKRDYYFAHVCAVEDKVRELFGECFKLRVPPYNTIIWKTQISTLLKTW